MNANKSSAPTRAINLVIVNECVNFVAKSSKNVDDVGPLVEVFYGPQLKQKVASLEKSPTFSTFG